MLRRVIPLCLLLTATPSLAPAPALGQTSTSTDIVPCYDAERDLVTHGIAALCHGEVIDAAREAELAAERRRRVQATVTGGKADAVTANRRLVGTGSGFYITAGGEALTNNHVIDHCDQVTVTTEGAAKVGAAVVAADPAHDIALLRAAAPAPSVARFSAVPADAPGRERELAVVGYPAYGLPTIRSSLAPAAATPVVLASERNDIVFEGVIRRGHSGSPLLDEAGDVLGVVRAKPDSVKIYQATKKLPPDLGIAISQAATLRFLAEHGVHPTLAPNPAGAALARPALLDKARAFVVQVGCWR